MAVRQLVVDGDDRRADRQSSDARSHRADDPFDSAAERRQSAARPFRQIVDDMRDRGHAECFQPVDDDAAAHPDHRRDAPRR